MTRLATMLRLYIKTRGMSQKHLAYLIGISPTAVSMFLRGKPISTANYTKLAHWLLEVDPHECKVTK